MLKNLFLNTSAIRYDANNDQGAVEKTDVEKARETIAKNTKVMAQSDAEKEAASRPETEEEVVEEEPEEETGEENNEEEAEETPEQKAAREADETASEKEKRKNERIQKRIDKAVAAQRTAEAEVLKWKAIAEANPDSKLTEEQVNAKAEALANQRVADLEMQRAQKEFEKACDVIQDAANKLDKEFTPKVIEMANELGPIPSSVITILTDLENGPHVLKYMVDNIDEAENIYDLKDKPEKLAIALVRLSDKLLAESKPKPRFLSRVPAPQTPVNGSRVQTTIITGKETPEEHIRKRKAQMEERAKQRGY